MIKRLIEMEERFWTENVLGGIEPIDDGSEATSVFLDEKYLTSSVESVELPQDMYGLCDSIEQLSAEIEKLETEKTAAVNLIKAFMKNAETGHAGKHTVTWKTVSSSRLDSKKLKEEQPDIYGKYVRQTSCRRFSVT